MKDLNKTKNNASIEGKVRESDKKHDANVKSNSSLYFQIGLILCLLATYGLFEMKFKKTIFNYGTEKLADDEVEFYLPNIEVKPEPVPQEVQQQKPLAVLITKTPIIKDNDFVIKDPIKKIEVPDTFVPDPVPVVNDPTPSKTEEPLPATPFNMKDVERVPVFPGCKSAKNNAERMACMSEKLAQLIQKKFNTDLASELGLSGVQRIYVQFKIDDKGNVTDIKTRSPYSQLEKEAERVVNKIPVMTPGMQRNTPVSVIYNLPIVFQVH